MAVRTDVPEMSRNELRDRPTLDRKHIRRRLLGLGALIVVVVAAGVTSTEAPVCAPTPESMLTEVTPVTDHESVDFCPT